MALVVAVMQDPVLRLALRIERALVRHVGGAAGVSAVASSNAPVSAPTKEAILMAFLPLRRWCRGVEYACVQAAADTGKTTRLRHPRRGSERGQYDTAMWCARAAMRLCQDPALRAARRSGQPVGSIVGAGSCDAAMRARDARRSAPERAYFWQEVRSFSSIEKIAPASILMLRTRQARPVVSFKLAS